MSAIRIALAGDLHKRSKDITTISGYVACNNAVQLELMRLCDTLNIKYFISLGDWYDKGYVSDVAASLADYDLDIRMSNQLNGNFYGLIGNHIRLNMDSNPELHIIQPHPVYKSRRAVARAEQIMKTPDVLRIRDVQISFMHHKKDVKDVLEYKPKREAWAKYHIALFHTQSVVPNAMLLGTNYGYNSSPNTKIAEALTGVDLAIVGDIHTPLGQFNVATTNGTATMIVPGSLTNVDASEQNRHLSISIPIIDINEDSTVKLQYHHFDLKTNMVTFKKGNIEKSRDKLKTLRGKSSEKLEGATDVVAAISSRDETLVSLNAFMREMGYTDKDKAYVRSVINNPNDVNGLLQKYLEV